LPKTLVRIPADGEADRYRHATIGGLLQLPNACQSVLDLLKRAFNASDLVVDLLGPVYRNRHLQAADPHQVGRIAVQKRAVGIDRDGQTRDSENSSAALS
jgi:hypothetical protein